MDAHSIDRPGRAAQHAFDRALQTAAAAATAATYAVVRSGVLTEPTAIAAWLLTVTLAVLLGVPHIVARWLGRDVDALLAGDTRDDAAAHWDG